ncbi:protein FAM169B isoform X4 [Ursus maritimus]|uniref:Protein FAM169B isoform X4 n=1 Tax=Ursus maritimus TaxID=29073 RepID=A0A8M1GSG9_URSMA|nr:protein FAM169B isoform X4 [Ursus maritimus]
MEAEAARGAAAFAVAFMVADGPEDTWRLHVNHFHMCSSLMGGTCVYPVDILEDDPERHQEAALAYYAMLREGIRPSAELFSLPTGEQVKLEASSVCFCTVHRDEPQHKILVLVNPQDTKTVVAVYIKESWWPTEDVLRTSDPAREGLMKVQSFGERIVLFILNVVVFGRLERNLDDGDMFFLPHSVKEQAKILWRDGSAVGFYTTKRKGSLCGDGTGACYLLPVFDTVFVRKTYRRQGLGMAMLQDFCETFREDEALGVSWPISPAMYQVCRKFLLAHPEERGRLWEVEAPGGWGQRGSIWLKVQLQQSRPPDAHPGSAKENVSSQGQTSPDDGLRQSEESKKERTCAEWEETKSDQDCEVKVPAAGRLGQACGAGLEGTEAKRTAVAAGLAGESQQKHVRPSS